jgi:hypothetical protein
MEAHDQARRVLTTASVISHPTWLVVNQPRSDLCEASPENGPTQWSAPGPMDSGCDRSQHRAVGRTFPLVASSVTWPSRERGSAHGSVGRSSTLSGDGTSLGSGNELLVHRPEHLGHVVSPNFEDSLGELGQYGRGGL